VTLNDLKRRNDRYIALIHRIWQTCVPTHNRVELWRNLSASLLHFVVLHDVDVAVKAKSGRLELGGNILLTLYLQPL